MTMLAAAVDAVIGIGTHRDAREVEIAGAAGKPIAVLRLPGKTPPNTDRRPTHRP